MYFTKISWLADISHKYLRIYMAKEKERKPSAITSTQRFVTSIEEIKMIFFFLKSVYT